MLCFVLLLPIVAMAVQMTAPVRSMSQITGNELRTTCGTDLTPGHPSRFDPPDVWLGRMDTIGGSTYDLEFNGPAEVTTVYDPGYGIHACWMQSTDLAQAYPDRNMHYNFYDLSLTPPSWAFNQGADFMAWGARAHVARTGFGNLDVNTTTHCAYISAHYLNGTPTMTTMAQDQVPGSGSFTECINSVDDQLWPAVSLDGTGVPQIASLQDASATRTDLFYVKIDPWCTYSAPLGIAPPAPNPRTPSCNIAASKVSQQVVITWAQFHETGSTEPIYGYYAKSEDGGANWADAVQLPFPDIYHVEPDTQPTFYQASLYPWFDAQDSLHITGNCIPLIGGTSIPYFVSSIWDWTSLNNWKLITAVRAESALGFPQANFRSLCDRATISQYSPVGLVCVYEQEDPLNVDPTTGELRSDILAQRSADGGLTWGTPVQIRAGGSTNRIFPCAAQKPAGDSVDIIYLEDLIAGCSVPTQSIGAPSNNPIIHQRFAWTDLPRGDSATGAVAEHGSRLPDAIALGAAQPNPTHGVTAISYELPKAGNVTLRVYDEAGRPVRTLVNTSANPGRFTASWNGRNDNGVTVAGGVYFYTLTAGNTKLTKKLTLLQ